MFQPILIVYNSSNIITCGLSRGKQSVKKQFGVTSLNDFPLVHSFIDCVWVVSKVIKLKI